MVYPRLLLPGSVTSSLAHWHRLVGKQVLKCSGSYKADGIRLGLPPGPYLLGYHYSVYIIFTY